MENWLADAAEVSCHRSANACNPHCNPWEVGELPNARHPSSNARGFVRKVTGIEIPTHLDLMYPTLLAVRHLGGAATKSEMLEKVPEVARGFPTNNSLLCFRKTPSIRENPRFSTESGGLVRT